MDPKSVKRIDLKAANAALALRDDKIGRMAKQEALLWSGPAYRFDESKEFNDRLEVTIGNKERLPNVGDTPEESADRRVQLAQFAALVLTLHWDIPAELKRLANPTDSKLADIQEAYNHLSRANGRAPSQRAVAKKSGYHPSTVAKRWSLIVKNQAK
jgi:hypothetical protein